MTEGKSVLLCFISFPIASDQSYFRMRSSTGKLIKLRTVADTSLKTFADHLVVDRRYLCATPIQRFVITVR